jgi:predicted Zn-dependent protease
MGREDDADAVLRAAIERFPQESWPTLEYASSAHHRKNWPEAIARWEMLRTAWPDQALGYLRGAEALDALGQKEAGAQLRAEFARRSAT